MRALSIRQPFAELILRGIKTVEYRSRATKIIGERFLIYASKKPAAKAIWSDNLTVARPAEWMIQLAEQVGMIEPGVLLPTGVIVGSAVISEVRVVGGGLRVGNADDLQPATGNQQPTTYAWVLKDVRRAKTLRKPRGHPQPVWFNPFS